MTTQGQFWWLTPETAARTDLGAAAKLVLMCIRDHQGNNGHAWPSAKTIGQETGLGKNTVLRAIEELTVANLVTRAPGVRGRSALLSVTEWTQNGCTQNGAGEPKMGPGEPKMGAPVNPKWVPNHTQVTRPNNQTQKALIPEAVTIDPKPSAHRPTPAELESIYAAYPRRVAKQAALKAIAHALALITKRNGVHDPAAWLLARTQAYAASRASEDQKFTPYPATWFNRGSYDDDPGGGAFPVLTPEQEAAREAEWNRPSIPHKERFR